MKIETVSSNENITDEFPNTAVINTYDDYVDFKSMFIENENDIHRNLAESIKNQIINMKFSIIPIVNAAPPPPPEKPPNMKRSELPIDKKPHCDYNEYQDTLKLCPKFETRIINEMVQPYVCEYRRSIQDTTIAIIEGGAKASKAIGAAITRTKNDFKEYLRDPCNIQLRTCITVGGVLSGLFTARSKGIPKKLLFSGIGLLATGAMCFPRETDDGVRKFCYHVGAFLLNFVNITCSQSWKFKWRGSCKTGDDSAINCDIILGKDKELKK